jgi:hypothetical protein
VRCCWLQSGTLTKQAIGCAFKEVHAALLKNKLNKIKIHSLEKSFFE